MTSYKNPHFGLARLVRAFSYSIDGLATAWKNEVAFRQEIVLVALMLPPGLWYAESAIARAWLFGSLCLVLIVELLNSAIEATIDRISPERHELSKSAKDLGSAAVLVALINALASWALILSARYF